MKNNKDIKIFVTVLVLMNLMKYPLSAYLETLNLMTFLPNANSAEKYPAFSLAWSEYPSWSVFGVAHKFGLINGERGKYSPIEQSWEVDIVLEEAEYDPCLQMYGSSQVNAVCITNIDALNPSLRIPSVVIAPTSTSFGADGCLVVKKDIPDLQALKGKNTYGLDKSVSLYAFGRGIQQLGEDESQFRFVNMDPGAAALAMQQKQRGYEAIMVWNPFVLETLDKRKDVMVLFDTRVIPGEIIDSLVVSQETLDQPGGDRFALALLDTIYSVNKMLADPATRDKTLVAIGEKFSHLGLAQMKQVVQQTRFYENPEMALELFRGGVAFPGGKVATIGNLEKIMEVVTDFCLKHGFMDVMPTIKYGPKHAGENFNLRFDPSYLERYVADKKNR